MSCELRFVPLPHPLYPTAKRRRNSPFSADYSDTLTVLKRELAHLGAKHADVRIPYQGTDLRADGMPYAKARPTHPGVEVVAATRYGLLRFHGDEINDWKGNLRAIALHLEHLRLARLYGVGQRGEAYKGYLTPEAPEPPSPPPATKADAPPLTPEEAAAYLLLKKAGPERIIPGFNGQIYRHELAYIRDTPERLQTVYWVAAKRHHSDVGGSDDAMKEINAARDLLAAYQQKGK